MPRRSDEPHDRTYTCARDDEDAQVEAVAMFGKRGDDPDADMAIVCDDCYREIMGYS